MAENSKIEWCDHTFNPWIGCTKVSPACAHCYAETLMDTRYGRVKWGKGHPRKRTSTDTWKLPQRWNRAAHWHERNAEACGMELPRRPRVFCASLADWLDDEVPVQWLAELLDLICVTPYLDWLLLTKRPHLWRARLSDVIGMTIDSGPTGIDQACGAAVAGRWLNGAPPHNVWIGATVEDQERAAGRIPALLSIPAQVRFLSCEPLLGPVEFREVLPLMKAFNRSPHGWHDWLRRHLHWVICGGESGKDARPMHPDWARSLRDQCQDAGVPFFFKQWGEWVGEAVAYGDGATNYTLYTRVGKKAAGRLLDGREHNEFPSHE